MRSRRRTTTPNMASPSNLRKEYSRIRSPSNSSMTARTMARSVSSSSAWWTLRFFMSLTRKETTRSGSFRPEEPRSMSRKRTSNRTGDKLHPMTQAAVERAARADPDAQPLTLSDLKRLKRTPQAKVIRRALGLTQEEFAARYRIPLGTLRDWEQGRAIPDQPARAYLTVIAHHPQRVQQALQD